MSPIFNYYGRHHFNEIFFDNVRIPASNLVGEENRGWYHLMQALAFERRSIAPVTYGGFKRMLEELVRYARDTQYEGSHLSQNAMIRCKLADMAMELEMLKMFAYQLTWRMSQGAIPTYESSRNKVLSDEVMKRMALAGTDDIERSIVAQFRLGLPKSY